ncbi:very short patch repair endonuclease [Bradyrhizobium sp. SZCCHNRI3043]
MTKRNPSPAPVDPKRSANMARVRSKGNRSTELDMVRRLRAARLTGWRRHLRLPGTPDLAFPKAKVAVFLDGCFWHGCPKCYRAPKHNAEFWKQKVERNRKRDKAADSQLRAMGWNVVRVWEHSLRTPNIAEQRLRRALERAADAKQ